eukprot:8633384-Heterocapsa_arctica.AAC.1
MAGQGRTSVCAGASDQLADLAHEGAANLDTGIRWHHPGAGPVPARRALAQADEAALHQRGLG